MATAAEIIKDLTNSNFAGSNEEQMKMVQLMKGLATSDDPLSNKFMKAMDQAATVAGNKVLSKDESLDVDEEYIIEMVKKKKMKKEETGMCKCTNCEWQGAEEELEDGMCPECGSEIEMDEACSKKYKKEDVKPVQPTVDEMPVSFLQFVKEQEEKDSNDMDDEQVDWNKLDEAGRKKKYESYAKEMEKNGEKPLTYEKYVREACKKKK